MGGDGYEVFVLLMDYISGGKLVKEKINELIYFYEDNFKDIDHKKITMDELITVTGKNIYKYFRLDKKKQNKLTKEELLLWVNKIHKIRLD